MLGDNVQLEMLKNLIVTSIVFGLLVTSCATVKEARAEHKETKWLKMVAAYNENVEEKDKIICEERTPTGTHLPEWFCGTVTYWEKVEQLRDIGAIDPEITAAHIVPPPE